MKSHYSLLLVGATALAAGIVTANKTLDIAVIEPSCTCAPEFSSALKTSRAGYQPKSVEGRALAAEYARRGVVTDDGEHSHGEYTSGEWSPAISPIIAEKFAESGADCYFFAMPREIVSSDNGYKVTFTAYGLDFTFTTDRIIDTTPEFITHAYFGLAAPRLSYKLNYFVSVEVDSVKSDSTEAGGKRREELRSLPCPDGDVGAARLKLLEDETDPIILIGHELEMIPLDDTDCAVRVSPCYPTSLEAFDRGALVSLDREQLPTAAVNTVDDGEYDVIVVGLGTAGAMAAITAAGEGLRVLGIESLSMAGGSSTAGGVLGYYYGFKGGLYRKIDSEAHTFDTDFVKTGGVGEGQKITILDRYFKVENVDCRYRASFVGAITETSAKAVEASANAINVSSDGAVAESGASRAVSGIYYIQNGVTHKASAKYVIDCTAEASVCMSAGCEMQGGRVSDNRFQPYSSVYFKSSGASSIGYAYIDNGCVDQYDPDDFGSNILKSSTSYVHLRDNYSDHSYYGIAPLIGLTRYLRVVGEENIDFTSMIAGDFCDKPVYYGWSNLDNHGKDSALEDRIYQDFITLCGLWGYGVSIPVPMGALIPKGWSGLLVAGRNVADDHNLAMGLRMKDDCHKSGEAAAELAALAIKQDIPAKQVDVDVLREKLFKTGCLKPEDRVMLERQQSDEKYEYPLWCDDDAKLAEGLASDAPGYYMWSAKSLGKVGLLVSLLDSESENARANSAIALSMLDGQIPDASIPRLMTVLYETALTRDGYVPNTGRKYINFRSVSAICALGRLARAESVEFLRELLGHAEEIAETLPFEPFMLIADREDILFQYRSHILTALINIAKKQPELSDELKPFLCDYIEKHSFEVSMMGTVGFKLDCKPTLIKLTSEL